MILTAEEFARQTQEISKNALRDIRGSVKERLQAKTETILKRSAIPPRFVGKSFFNFDIGDILGRKRAMRICQRYADNFEQVLEKGICLVLTGRSGTGKTHLATAVLSQVIRAGSSGLFTNVSGMLSRIRSAYSPANQISEQAALDHFTNVDLLVLDEVGISIGTKDKRIALMFDVINTRYEQLKPTIIIGNLTPGDMKEYLGIRIWDRLMDSEAPVVPFDWDSYRDSYGGASKQGE